MRVRWYLLFPVAFPTRRWRFVRNFQCCRMTLGFEVRYPSGGSIWMGLCVTGPWEISPSGSWACSCSESVLTMVALQCSHPHPKLFLSFGVDNRLFWEYFISVLRNHHLYLTFNHYWRIVGCLLSPYQIKRIIALICKMTLFWINLDSSRSGKHLRTLSKADWDSLLCLWVKKSLKEDQLSSEPALSKFLLSLDANVWCCLYGNHTSLSGLFSGLWEYQYPHMLKSLI